MNRLDDCRKTLHDGRCNHSKFTPLTKISSEQGVFSKLHSLGTFNASNAAWTACLQFWVSQRVWPYFSAPPYPHGGRGEDGIRPSSKLHN